MFDNDNSRPGTTVPDVHARTAIAFAAHNFPGGLVPVSIRLFELARLAEESATFNRYAFCLRNSARELGAGLALMPRLTNGPQNLRPLVDAVLSDPTERADGLILSLCTPHFGLIER
jgi:hypothetical protein